MNLVSVEGAYVRRITPAEGKVFVVPVQRIVRGRYMLGLALAGALLTAAGCAAPRTGPAALQRQLDALFDDPRFSEAYWGVRVETLNGNILYDRLGHKQFIPASNLKVFTTAAALERLGPDFTYETRLNAVGPIGGDGTLNGSLVIVGSGDPSLGAWHPDEEQNSRQLLASWVEQIKAAGIRRIAGDIVGDGRCFTEEFIGPHWEYYDLPFWYSAGSSGLAMEENAFRCYILPTKVGEPAFIEIVPQTAYITLINATRTVEAGGVSNADSTNCQVEGNTVKFAGTIAMDKPFIRERAAIWDGARYAAFLLQEALERGGVSVAGRAVNIRDLDNPASLDAAEARTLAVYASPPMSELVKVVNKPSHNFFADQILRTMGLQRRGVGSFDAGVEEVRAWLAEIGVPQTHAIQMFDGSGLARDNLIQPRQMCHVLRHMARPGPGRAEFVDSLPVAGVDGNLARRMTEPPTRGNVRAKTGYISNARTLSGYVTHAGGQQLVFALMCNQYTVPTREVNEVQDRTCVILASWEP